MPIVVCPECESQLRLGKPVPPGKWLRCPKCEHTFSPTGEEDVEEVEDTPKRSKRRAAVDDDIDEEDRPRKPRKKKQGSGNLTVILLAAGGGVVLLGAIVALVIVFWPTSKHEAAIKDTLKLLNELAAILETVQDEKSARAAAEKINGLKDRFESLSKRMEELSKPSKEEDERLRKKYEDELTKAMDRLQKATIQAMGKMGTDRSLADAMQNVRLQGPKRF